MKKIFTILAIGSGLFLSNAQAEIESEFHVGYNSKYIFRGVDRGDDAYEYGLDFAGTSDYGFDWSAGIWGISPDNSDGNVDELDIYASVSKLLGNNISLSAGFTAFTYDDRTDDAELFVGVSTLFSGYDAGITLLLGTDGILQNQVLLEATVGHTHSINDRVSAAFGLTYGYLIDNGDAGYASDNGFAYFNATFNLSIALSEDITFSPYVSAIDGGSRVIGSVSEEIIGGASLSFSF